MFQVFHSCSKYNSTSSIQWYHQIFYSSNYSLKNCQILIFPYRHHMPNEVIPPRIRLRTCSKCSKDVPSTTRRALSNALFTFSKDPSFHRKILVLYRHWKREFFKMAEFPFATGIENGSFSKWRNSRLLPALKTGIFQNGGTPVCYGPWKREFFKMAEFLFSIGIENGNFR